MNKEVKIFLAAAGIATTLTAGLNLQENTSNTNKINSAGDKTQDNGHLVPIPCPHPLPWEPGYGKDTKNSSFTIELASIKKPEPTRDPYPAECWVWVTDSQDSSDFSISQ